VAVTARSVFQSILDVKALFIAPRWRLVVYCMLGPVALSFLYFVNSREVNGLNPDEVAPQKNKSATWSVNERTVPYSHKEEPPRVVIEDRIKKFLADRRVDGDIVSVERFLSENELCDRIELLENIKKHRWELGSDYYLMIERIWSAWFLRDPKAFSQNQPKLAAIIGDFDDYHPWLTMALDKDYEKVADAIEDFTTPSLRKYAIEGIVTRYVASDINKALNWTKRLNAEDQSSAMYAIALAKMVDEPDISAEVLGLVTGVEQRARLIQGIANNLTRKDPNAAIAWIRSLENDSEQLDALKNFAIQYSQYQPKEGPEYLLNVLDSKIDQNTYYSILDVMAMRSPEAAREYAKKLESRNPDGKYLQRVNEQIESNANERS
jgi:hypothetical protein